MLLSVMLYFSIDAPPAKRCKMESSPQTSGSSPSLKLHDTQSTSTSSSAYLSTSTNSGTSLNLQTSSAPPPNVVIPPQHTSNPPSVGSTASQSATPIQLHPPTAAVHGLPNQLNLQQNFSPQASGNVPPGSVTVQQQSYAHSYPSSMQQQQQHHQGNVSTSYAQQTSQQHSTTSTAAGSSVPASNNASNIDFDSVSCHIVTQVSMYDLWNISLAYLKYSQMCQIYNNLWKNACFMKS